MGFVLLFKSFSVLLDRELGFEPQGRLAVQVFACDYEDGAARSDFVRRTLDEMEALPGVDRVALASTIPTANDEGALSSIDIDLAFTVEERAAPPPGQEPTVRINMVSTGYFETLEIPLVEGRGFTLADDGQAPPVVVVNEAFVRRHFAGEDPPGERIVIGFSEPRAREVVGVVRDVRPGGFESEPRPLLYFPLTQQGTGSPTFVLAVETGVAAASLTRPAIGLLSFSVEQRVAELGIRRALGGGAGSILVMILGEGAALAVAGVVRGTGGAFVLGRFLRGMLFEVRPTNPAVFVLPGAAVVAVAGLATLAPALRAIRADPMVALRGE